MLTTGIGEGYNNSWVASCLRELQKSASLHYKGNISSRDVVGKVSAFFMKYAMYHYPAV